MRRSDRLVAVAFGLAATLLVAFVLLPIASVFVRVPPATLLLQLRSKGALDALAVSMKTTTIALALILFLGTPAAYLLGTRSFRGSIALETILEVPLVLPPAVAGIALLAAFGRGGLLGRPLRAMGIEVGFTQAAVVMALIFVAMPFYVRQAVAAFGSVDRQMLAASRTLGAGQGETFVRVAVPLAAKGLGAGAALAFARALGEFGATIMFAGNFPGSTQTLPLAVYAQYSGDNLPGALALAALLVAVSVGLLVAVKLILRASRADQERAGWMAFSSSRSGTA